MGTEQSERLIYLLLLYTASIWGFNVVIIKVLTAHFDVIMLSTLRMGVAGLAIGAFAWYKWGKIPRISLSQFRWIVLVALFMIYSHQILLALGLLSSTATNGSLILALNPLFSVFLSFLFLKEKIKASRVTGIFLGLLGVCLVVLNKSGAAIGSIGLGDFILLASMIVYVLGAICVRKISSDVDPLLIAFYMHLIGTAILVVHSAFRAEFYEMEGWFPGWFPWLLVLISGIASTALGNVFWNMGISSIGVGRTSLFPKLVAGIGLISAIVFLDESIRFIHFIGLICVLIGVYLGVRRAEPFLSTQSSKKVGHEGRPDYEI